MLRDTNINADNRKLRITEAVFLFFSVFFIRFPFFFRDYIDRDESTFILMGQSVADGHLPYVHLWDLKPPLLFFIFGGVETIFPDSFVAIRFLGVLVVFISAMLILGICKQSGIRNGFLAALLYIILSSELGNLQGLMSEHFAVMFMLAGLWFFLKKGNIFNYFLAGLAFGCALLCKMSFAYGVAALLLCTLVLQWKHERLIKIFLNNSILVLALLLPFFVIAIPYIKAGHWGLYFDSVVLAPLEYSNAEHISFSRKIRKTWIIILATLLISWFAFKRSKQEQYPVLAACIAIALATVYTFFSSGILNGHYLILVYPFLLILLFGFIIKKQLQFRWLYLALFVVLISAEAIMEYGKTIKAIRETGSPYHGQSFRIVEELRKQGLDREKIFFIDYHIGYWMLDQYPLTKSTTHPSNLRRPFLFKYFGGPSGSMEEIKNIMENIRPAVIAGKSPNGLGFFPYESPESRYFEQKLTAEYRPLLRDDKKKVYIWQRVN